MNQPDSIEIQLSFVSPGLMIFINERWPDTLFDSVNTFEQNNEARFQLVEGCFYDYEINNSEYVLQDPGGNIVRPHRRNPWLGTLAPNIYVGTLEIPVIEKETGKKVADIKLEVRSVKSGYRDDYRNMLEFITEKCTDLLLQAESPVSHSFETDYSKDSSTLYQRFMFVRSIVATDDFNEAVHRVISSPVTRWDEEPESRDVRNIRRFSNADVRKITKSGRHTLLPDAHYLGRYGIKSLRERIISSRKIDSTDAPENRFVKYVLETILRFCDDIYQ